MQAVQIARYNYQEGGQRLSGQTAQEKQSQLSLGNLVRQLDMWLGSEAFWSLGQSMACMGLL